MSLSQLKFRGEKISAHLNVKQMRYNYSTLRYKIKIKIKKKIYDYSLYLVLVRSSIGLILCLERVVIGYFSLLLVIQGRSTVDVVV